METVGSYLPKSISPAEAVQLGATSLVLYGRIFFPKTFRQESPPFHEEIGQALMARTYSKIGIEVFRDGAKTTLLRTFISQRIAYGISRTILVVSASQGHSVLTLRWVKRQVEHNTKWANTFRLRKGSKWTDDHVEIIHEAIDEPITLLALGITGQVRGFNIDDRRPDLILCDDTSTDSTSGSPEQRAKELNTVFGALLNSLTPLTEAPDAKAVVLDTPKSKFDLIEGLERNPEWKFFRYGIFDEEGNSRWEARYPTEVLKKQKENAIRVSQLHIWMKEKECKIVSTETAKFNPLNLQYWDTLPPRASYIIAIDPASSDNKKADDNVVGVLAFYKDETYLVEYEAAKGQDPEKVTKTVFEYIRRWRPIGIVVESVSYQRVLAWYIERAMQEQRCWVPVYRVQDKRAKADRIIQALGESTGLQRFYCLLSHVKFIEQYTEFAPGVEMHDDVIDMVSLGIHWGKTQGISDWIEGEWSEVEDEDGDYRRLNFRSAP